MFSKLLIPSCLLAVMALTSFSTAAAEVENEIALQMYTLRSVGSA